MRSHAAECAALAALCLLSACAQRPEPQPVTNPRAAQFLKLPDWRGFWAPEGLEAGIDGFPIGREGKPPPYPLVGLNAPWNDVGRREFQTMLASMGSRKTGGWGYPMMMSSLAPLQFLVTPEETLIVNQYREVRHAYTDGRTHPAPEDRWETTWGDSIGRWEGDTLVIDTISVREPIKYFFFVPTLSSQAHYVEKLRMTGTDRIESEVTIEDPARLTGPWVTRITYVRQTALERMVHDDFTNDRSEVENGVFTIEPPKSQ